MMSLRKTLLGYLLSILVFVFGFSWLQGGIGGIGPCEPEPKKFYIGGNGTTEGDACRTVAYNDYRSRLFNCNLGSEKDQQPCCDAAYVIYCEEWAACPD